MSNNQITPNKTGESTLKPTPKIEPKTEDKAKSEKMQLEVKISENLIEIEDLTKLSKQYRQIDNTLTELKDFSFKGEETAKTSLTIVDNTRQDFTTKNPRLIEALVVELMRILETKKTELALQISQIKISI